MFLNRIFIFLLEYYDSYIAFTYRKYFRQKQQFHFVKASLNSSFDDIFFWVFFVNIDKFFLNRPDTSSLARLKIKIIMFYYFETFSLLLAFDFIFI